MDISLLLPGEDSLPDPVTQVARVYAGTDARIAAWRAPVRCPHGCGTCCERTVPSATQAEAEYLARYLIATNHPRAELVMRTEFESPPCPFYDPDAEFHCTVYEARPLMCRTFGYTGSPDRNGSFVYRLCRFMPTPDAFGGERTLTEAGLRARELPSPPDSQALTRQLPAASEPGEFSVRIDVALRDRLAALLLKRQLLTANRFAGAVDPPENDRPDRPQPPGAPRKRRRA